MAVEHWEELAQEFLTNFFRFVSTFGLKAMVKNIVLKMIYLSEPFNV